MSTAEDKDAPEPGKGEGKAKKWVKFALKLIVSALAMYFVAKKVDFQKSMDAIWSAEWGWVLASMLLFNLTKLISTLRLKYLAKPLGIDLPHGYNIRLYYIGAFYNMFLPGSIGGDGYKVWLLKQRYPQSRTKQLLVAIFLDRFSGMAALAFITGIMVELSDFRPAQWPWFIPLVLGLTMLCYPVFYIVYRLLFKDFLPAFWSSSWVSLLTQVMMLGVAWCLLQALGIDANQYEYLVVFMVASVVSILPLTLGGLGAREATFAFAQGFMPIEEAQGVAFALLIFTVLAFSSLIGMVMNFVGKD